MKINLWLHQHQASRNISRTSQPFLTQVKKNFLGQDVLSKLLMSLTKCKKTHLTSSEIASANQHLASANFQMSYDFQSTFNNVYRLPQSSSAVLLVDYGVMGSYHLLSYFPWCHIWFYLFFHHSTLVYISSL